MARSLSGYMAIRAKLHSLSVVMLDRWSVIICFKLLKDLSPQLEAIQKHFSENFFALRKT